MINDITSNLQNILEDIKNLTKEDLADTNIETYKEFVSTVDKLAWSVIRRTEQWHKANPGEVLDQEVYVEKVISGEIVLDPEWLDEYDPTEEGLADAARDYWNDEGQYEEGQSFYFLGASFGENEWEDVCWHGAWASSSC